MTKNKIKTIEKYGKVYIDRFLKQQKVDREIILNDWYKALNFFFGKSFMRGRNDELSERFWKATMRVLDEHVSNIQHYDRTKLNNDLIVGGVRNGKDRNMVLGTLNFIFGSLGGFGNNMVEYAVSQIKSHKLNDAFADLDTIPEVGNKITSFFLRDVVMVYNLESFLTNDDFKYCQPIDTWVEQTALALNIIKSGDIKSKMKSKKQLSDKEVQEIRMNIISACLETNVSPLLFNAGAWMVGAKSFELLIERL